MEVDKFLGRTYLGSLCRREHDNGNGMSVRYTCDRTCVTCHQENNAKFRVKTTVDLKTIEHTQQIAYNRKMALEKGDSTYLGGICKCEHAEVGEFCRRYTVDRGCIVCRRIGKRTGSRDADSPILRPKPPKEAKPKGESKPSTSSKKKKYHPKPAAVPIYVSRTINQEKIDADYRQRMEDMKRLEYQMKREEKL